MKKVISLILSISIIFSCVSTVSAADLDFSFSFSNDSSVTEDTSVGDTDTSVDDTSDESEAEEVEFEEFADDLTQMLQEYEGDSDNAMDGVISDSVEPLYSSGNNEGVVKTTNRLIVKSEVAIDELDSVACVSGYDDLYILQFASYEDCLEAYEYYSSLDTVEYVQEDGYYQVTDEETDDVFTEATVEYSTQYQSDYFGYSDAKAYMGSGRVVIAVVDSGVQNDHERLVGRVEPTGFDAINNESCYDTRGHGTHVAGIIAANTKDNVIIRPYKVLNDSGEGTDTQVYLGIQAAIEDQVDIINLSLTKKGDSEILREVITEAYDAGITVVTAAGNNNENLSSVTYSPSSFPEVICAVSIDTTRYKASTSNWGSTKDLSAPGVNILSTYLNNTYKVMSGTSMAAPYISCAVAYLLANDNSLTPDAVYTELYNSTTRGGGTHNIRYVVPGLLIRNNTVTATPVFEIEPGEFAGYLNIIISCSTSGAEILYRTSGMAADTYVSYTAPFRIDSTETITAYAISAGNKDSASTSAKYTKSSLDSSVFIVDENGTLTGYTGADTALTVPQYCNGSVVKSIASTAFSGNENLVSVTCSKYLMTFEDGAFEGCTNLESIVAPGVTTLYKDTFKNCLSLKTLELSALTAIPDELFANSQSITELSFDSLKTIGKKAFYNTTGLVKITAPSLTVVGESAFENSGITSLSAANLTTIESMAFYKSNLNTATFAYAAYVGDYAFAECKNLISINMNYLTNFNSVNVFRNCPVLKTVTMNNATNLPGYTFYNCPSLTNLSMSAVTAIEEYAFYNTGLTSVTLPNVTDMALDAFNSCTSLEEVTLKSLTVFNPEYFTGCSNITHFSVGSVTSFNTSPYLISEYFPKLSYFGLTAYNGTIPAYTFANCSNLSEFTFGLTAGIGDYAFSGTALETIPDGNQITTVGEKAFSNNDALTTVVMANLTSFDPDYFANCTGLTSINVSKASVTIDEGYKVVDYIPNLETFSASMATNIPDYFFKDHNKITTVNMKKVTTIGTEAFMSSTIVEPYFNYATTVGDRAFADCKMITYVDLPALTKIDTAIFEGSEPYIYELGLNGVSEIYEGDYETFNFSEFTNLRLINLNSLTVIPKEAFKDCTSLTTIYIDKVTKICDNAFNGCTSLKEIDIPLVTEVGTSAFKGCTALQSFHADGITTIDSNLFNGCTQLKSLSLNSIVFLPVDENGTFNMAGIDNLESFSANNINAIPNNFLKGYSKLKTVSFTRAKSIGSYAFYGTAIESYDFGVHLISVGDYAFAGTPITEVSSDYLEFVGDYAFADCTSLTTVYLDNAEEIGDYAFSGCTSLADFISYNITDGENLPVTAFYGCTGLKSLQLYAIDYLPVGSDGRTYITDAVELEEFTADAIAEIPDNYFAEAEALISISCNSLTEIGDNAFRNSGITSIEFNSLEKIGDYAFYNTELSDSISFNYVTEVGDYAFASCENLLSALFLSTEIELGVGAFEGDTSLTKVRLPDYTAIPDKCFKNCYVLYDLYQRGTDKVIITAIGNEAFLNCESLGASEIELKYLKSIGTDCLKGTLIYEYDELASADVIAPDLKTIADGAFDGIKLNSLALENVKTVYSLPESQYVLIGSDVEVFDIPYTETTVFAPAYTVVKDGCAASDTSYKPLDSSNAFIEDVALECDPIDGDLEFKAVGFDLSYQWYGCNNENRSDSVLIYETEESDENFFVPVDYMYNDYDEYDYRYYYCIAISVENGNVVYIKSGLSSNTYVQVLGSELTEVNYNSGIIYTDSTNNINSTAGIFSALGDNVEIIPSASSTSTSSYGTGTVVKVMAVDEDDLVIKEYVLVVYGDINGDGVVDAIDAQGIAAYTNGNADFDNHYYRMAADLNGSDSVSVEDYQAAINKVIGA